jgi:hypothetical protein
VDNQDVIDQIQEMLDEHSAQQPQPADYTNSDGSLDQVTYQAQLSAWQQDQLSIINSLKGYQDDKMGILTLPDGTIVPTSHLSPEQQRGVSEYNDRLYNQLMAKYGLDQYSLRRQSALDENQRRLDDYNAQVDQFKNKMAVDDSDLSRSLASLDRWMKGQTVAGDDASRIQTAQQEASKYGTTDGKTSFSGRDLGAGVSMLAQQGGIPLDAPLINYPGVQTWDPVADRQRSAASLGISDQAPAIPMPSVGMADVPALPAFDAVPSGGGGSPMPVAPPHLPPWQPPGLQGSVNNVAGKVAGGIQSFGNSFVNKLIAGSQPSATPYQDVVLR